MGSSATFHHLAGWGKHPPERSTHGQQRYLKKGKKNNNKKKTKIITQALFILCTNNDITTLGLLTHTKVAAIGGYLKDPR